LSDEEPKRCTVDGCSRRDYARELCEAHYRRRLRTGSTDTDRPVGVAREPNQCMVDSCTNDSTERGLCHGHYLRLIRNGDVLAARPLSRRVNDSCVVDSCANKATARGLCPAHRARKAKTGEVQADVPIKQVSGTGFVTRHGYRVVPIPRDERWLVHQKGSEFEHRYVMTKMLGRPLTRDESVHHRNGDRLDNRPENLELWSRYQPSGQRVCDKIEYAMELLHRYLPDATTPPLPLDL
jgi:hypothetical protein